MAADERRRRLWWGLGLLVLFIPAAHLIGFFAERSDIWWTPRALAVPLADSNDRVEIYVAGQLLQHRIDAGRLQVLTDRGPVTLTAADITLRFNNRDRVRADQIPFLLASAMALAGVGVLMVVGLLGLWPRLTGQPPARSGGAQT